MARETADERVKALTDSGMIASLTDANMAQAQAYIDKLNAEYAFELPAMQLDVIPVKGGGVFWHGEVTLTPNGADKPTIFQVTQKLPQSNPKNDAMSAAIHVLSERRKAERREIPATEESALALLGKLTPEALAAVMQQVASEIVAGKKK